MHNRTAEDMVTCVPCKRTFIDKKTYREHVRNTHLNQEESKCPDCPKIFKSLRRLRYHMVRHNKERTIQCSCCSKMFVDNYQLKQHMRVHNDDRQYICDVCGQAFKTLNSLNRHSLTHASDSTGDLSEKRKAPGNGHLKCPLCKKTFSQCPTLRNHLKKGHPFEGPMQWEKMAIKMCYKCNEMFPTPESLKDHRETHNNFQCDVCKQHFTSKESLQYHVLTHSSKERPFKCMVSKLEF